MFSKLKYRLLTVMNVVDDSSNLASESKVPLAFTKTVESTRHSNYRTLTVENAIEKTRSISISEDALNLQIERILTPGQLHYRTFHPGSDKGPEC
jgi:hypothetical protein